MRRSLRRSRCRGSCPGTLTRAPAMMTAACGPYTMHCAASRRLTTPTSRHDRDFDSEAQETESEAWNHIKCIMVPTAVEDKEGPLQLLGVQECLVMGNLLL